MHTLRQDLRYALRMLRKNPGFTTVAVLTVALGIGATTGIFSVVNTVLLRPLPYGNPQQLARIYTEFPTFPHGGLRRFWTSAPEYFDLKRDMRSWETIDAWIDAGANLAGGATPVRITNAYVSGGLLKTLGVAPALGRLITPADDLPGAPLVADISYGLWQRVFGGDRSVIGRDTLFNGTKCTVVGVMPRGFQFPPGEVDPPETWVPLQLDPAKPGSRGSHNYYLLGRLKPGVTVEQARSEFSNYVRASGEHASATMHQFNPKNHTLVTYPLQDEVVGGIRPALLMLLGAVCFVLLIACANVASLLLARAEAREREVAIRSALGAATRRLLRQFITEGILLAFAGAVVGLLLAFGGLALIRATNDGSVPRLAELSLDYRVLLFALGVSVATGLFFGIAPLAHLVVGNLHDRLKSGSGRVAGSTAAERFRRGMVVAQLALALTLLVGTGLMMRAFWKLQQVDVGVDPRGLITMEVNLPNAIYKTNDAIDGFWVRLQQQLDALPGVQSATLAYGLPPERPPNENDTEIEGFVKKKDGPIQNVDYYQVAGDHFFQTMGIRLMEGRFFNAQDGPGAPNVLIVNETMARTFWGDASPLGRRVRPGFSDPWCTVVGVVADVKNAGIDKPAGTELFLPVHQKQAAGVGSAYLILRSAVGDPNSLVGAARRVVNGLDPQLPVSKIRTMDDVILGAQARPRFLTVLLTIFAGVALILAAVGLYGVISYGVAQRTQEFGVRMVLGARPTDVLGMVLRQGGRLVALGVVLGLAGALVLTRTLSSLLFGIRATDPITYVAVSLVLALVALLASYIPARRATKVDPMVALRYE